MASVGTKMRALMKTPPYKFQIRGVRFLERVNGNGLIGDDMGCGKSYQTIAWMALHPEVRPVVIICPSSLKWAWQRELWHHARIDSSVAETREPEDLDGDVWITNYDILSPRKVKRGGKVTESPGWLEHFRSKHPLLVVIDESQKIKNLKAKQTVAVRRLGKDCRHVIGLSGTPITNGPVDFFPILNLVAPGKFPDFYDYAQRYCGPKRGWQGRGWDYSGASNLKELHELVSAVMIRRKKTEVLKDLPPKTRTIIPVKIDNAREYVRAQEDIIGWLTEVEGKEAAERATSAESLVRMAKLLKLAAAGKMATIIRWTHDFLDGLLGEPSKLVLFCKHTAVLEQLWAEFPRAAVVSGATRPQDRLREVDRFQNDPHCRLFIGNLTAAGIGLTLTAASTVGFVEFSWVPADHEQGEDRVLRIGQTASHVDAFYFVAKGTIEEDVMETVDEKRDVVGRVLDGDQTVNVRTRILKSLLRRAKD